MSESLERPTISLDLDRRIHFAMQQNDVPVVKALRIENRSEMPLRDLQVRISAEPDFARCWSTRVADVAAHAVYNLTAVDLDLSPGFLGELTERVRGRLHGEILRGDVILAEAVAPVELLARDEWGGLSSLPEILAAFVLPNHPAVERVLRNAAELLAAWTGDPSLNGYQDKDPRRVLAITAAVYAALQGLAITYVNPPASFEEDGQRVRLPDRILESSMATCLDVALFAAACLEQAGLNPLVVVVESHAFAGVWLGDECFPEPAVDDGLRLRKRVDLNELAVFDPTGVTARPPLTFEQAVAEARRHLESEGRFRCAIDVRRARKGRIRPLPERMTLAELDEAGDGLSEVMTAPPSAPVLPEIVIAPEPEVRSPDDARETPATRLDRWRRRLLDLTLRNRLLNFRDTKKTLPLLFPDLGRLEDLLAGGVTFKILSRPRDLAADGPRDAGAHRRRTGQEGIEELLREELESHRLYADTTGEELDRRIIEIYRAARVGLEEGGASALYLAIGFLAWYETENSEQRRLAPLLLVPLEVHRQSIREGFSLRLADDEPRFNVTLLELLHQDHGLTIPGLDPLPGDESGLDVPRILRTVRRAVRDVDRWDVLDEARIGLFSFTKFLMWRDLSERADELMTNAVVEHLVRGHDQPFDPEGAFPRREDLDDEHAPSETFCPLPADSSQLAAVFAAAAGRCFVLEGPPGTGKSQTIANLIAHCLTEGKTVLFVSEKMAALNVVHRRLVQVGLGRYCLELHSSKTHKRDVIGQLEEALERLDAHDQGEWEREALRLAELRNELNAYVRALHETRSTGESIFRVTSRLIGLRDTPRVALRWPTPDAHDAEALGALRDLVQRLATAAAAGGEIRGHAFEAVRRSEWSPAWQQEVERAVTELRRAAETLEGCARACSERLGFAAAGWSLEELRLLRELTLVLMESPAPPIEIVVRSGWEEIDSGIGAWIEHGRARDRLRNDVGEEGFRVEIIALDLDSLRTGLERASASRWPLSWWRMWPVQRSLRSVALDGRAPRRERLRDVLDLAYGLREDQRKLDAASEAARVLLGRFWNDGEAEWDVVSRVREWARRLRELALRAARSDFELAASLRDRWARLASDLRELLGREGRAGREFISFGDALESFTQSRDRVAERLDLEAPLAWGSDSAPDALGRTRSRTAAWQESLHRLRYWCAWRRARAEAARRDVSSLVEAYEQGEITCDQMGPVFERSYAQWWLDAMVDREPVLNQFFSPEHERKIERFRSVDDRYMELTRGLIQARLAQQVPAMAANVTPNSEVGILKRQIGLKRRQLSIRQLLERIPNLLPRLKPCLLMSPMSVAQYLDAGYPPFDVVVFDEASQIPVWDAVGAIARGHQAVVVGDPKQLPPTNFFQRVDDDDDVVEEDVVEDLESILEECITARLPSLSLEWHYRSRHESLITFSNYHYYRNRLLTFPSPMLSGLGVSWQHVPQGVYDKGKSRTNRAEADAVVADILSRLRHPEQAQQSIGVVTFSQAQQTLIEDLLDAARAEDPQLDPYFAEDNDEPVFVKNLENVQGDERDVILFSICYGPDALGRVSMNFGPMNRDGGERRLNVAVTRARLAVKVFSTLRADQVDLNRTRARGVRDLKGFLEYAERGPSALAEATQPDPDADFDSPFEEAVWDALVQRGWQVHMQVGCARYRIDLAVLDPEAAGRYLLGVECDGANYHRARTARDRDKLREGVLRDLGWKLHRIWSTDWWTDPQRELDKLEAALERARTEGAGPSIVAARGDGRRTLPPPSLAPAENAVRSGISSETPALPLVSDLRAAPAVEPPDAGLARYQPIDTLGTAGSQADFYDSSAVPRIRSVLSEVVRHEGPISLRLAARRVAACWGFERVRAPALDRIRRLIPRDQVVLRRSAAGEFLWPGDVDPETFATFRVPGAEGDGERDATDLPLEEVCAGVRYVLDLNLSTPREELVRQTARLFGFGRVGSVVAKRIDSAVDALIEKGVAREDDGLVSLSHEEGF